MKHNWKKNGECSKCHARRKRWLPFGRSVNKAGEESSPFRYRLADGGEREKRPACAGKGQSRTSRRNGRAAKVIARSRAGGPRARSREDLALLRRLFATPLPDATPAPTPTEAPIAS